MTKKSQARLLRDQQAKIDKDNKTELDEFFETNTAWTDLIEVYESVAHQIAGLYGAVLHTYKDPIVMANLSPIKFGESKALLRGLSSDIEVFTSELVNVRSQHQDKTGGATSVEDFQMVMVINEKYMEIQTRFDGTTHRTIQSLMEDAAAAIQQGVDLVHQHATPEQIEEIRQSISEPVAPALDSAEEKVLQDLTDVNVVSDVVAKPVTQ